MKKRVLLLLVTISVSSFMHAQWYFETGVNDAKFTEYVNPKGTKTTLHSYTGLRDMSTSLGYVFPFKSLDERIEENGQPAVFRLAVGLGFDQMNLLTKVDINNMEIPIHYNMAMVQGQLNALFTPSLIRKKQADPMGFHQPAINLLLQGGLSYGFYTSAVRTYTTNTGGYVTDLLKDDKQFVRHYPIFSFGAGFEFPINGQTTLYTKYVFDNAFSSDEGGNEAFSVSKQRFMIGLRTDFSLSKHFKKAQRERMDALEEKMSQTQEPEDLSPLYEKIEALENALETAIQEKTDQPELSSSVSGNMYPDVKRENGYTYIPVFKPVLFTIGSSNIDLSKYGSTLRKLALFLTQNQSLILKLEGYADSKTGSTPLNNVLSKKRAKSVYDYLISLGVSESQMTYRGAGETLKFSVKANRRTEITILEK